jgi:hypothetical protein
MNRDRVTGWVERVRRDGAATVELRLGSERVRAWPLESLSDCDVAAEAVVVMDEESAEQPTHGLLSYRLVALRSDDREPFARLMLPVQPKTTVQESVGSGDSAASGALHVLQDHAREQGSLIRDLVRLQIEARAGGEGLLLEHNRQLTRQVVEYEKRRIAMYEVYEDALSHRQQRENEARLADLAEKRQQYLADRIDMLFPLVLNRVLGGGRGKGAPAGNEMFRSLLGSMTPAQIDALTSGQPFAWSQEQTVLIGELYTSFAREAEDRKRKRGDGEGVSIQLDSNLPDALVARILTALGTETDADVLEAMAAELNAEYPLARQALTERAARLRKDAAPNGGPR